MILQDKIKTFCYLGLIPFILLPISAWISPDFAANYDVVYIFFLWSISMAFFMAGTLWGLSFYANKSIYSSIRIFAFLFLVLIVSYRLDSNQLGSILLTLLFVYEYIYSQEKKSIEDDWYKSLRFQLTFSIRICHLLMIGFIFTIQ